MTISVIVPIGGAVHEDPWRRRAFDWLMERYVKLLPNAEVVWGISHSDPYNRAEARNAAVAESTKSILLLADADTVFHPRQIEAGLAAVRNGAPWCILYGLGRYYNLSQGATNQVLAADPGVEIPEPNAPDLWEHKLDSWAGLLMISRDAWNEVGGYPTNFRGWGYEDDAFRIIMDTLVGKHVRIDDFVMHLWHERGIADFHQPHIDHNRRLHQEYLKCLHRPERMRRLLDGGDGEWVLP